MFRKYLLSFFGEEELNKCFGYFTSLMLINIFINNRNWVLDQNCRGRNDQLIILTGLLPNQHFIFIGNGYIACTSLKIGDALACTLIENSDVLQNRPEKVSRSGLIIRWDTVHLPTQCSTVQSQDVPARPTTCFRVRH